MTFLGDIPVYAWAALAGLAIFGAVYSIRKYLELKNAPAEDDLTLGEPLLEGGLPPVPEPAQEELPLGEPQPDSAPLPELPPLEELPAPAESSSPAELPLPAAEPEPPSSAAGPAVAFVKGIYDGVSGLDSRLKRIEASMSHHGPGDDFTIKFLEDMVADFDSLDRAKLRARLEYLLADLKK